MVHVVPKFQPIPKKRKNDKHQHIKCRTIMLSLPPHIFKIDPYWTIENRNDAPMYVYIYIYGFYIRSPICCCMQEKRHAQSLSAGLLLLLLEYYVPAQHTSLMGLLCINGLYSCTAAAAAAHHTGQRIPPDTAGGLLSITSIEPSSIWENDWSILYIYI